MEYQRIADLPDNWQMLQDDSLHSLAELWQEQRERLEATSTYQTFQEKMRRKIAIETGIIEQLYTIDRGITYMLIEQGIDVALIPHGSTDKPATQIVKLIRDQESAVGLVFGFVGDENNRVLSTSFIKQLHQMLTRNQDTTEALDQFGKIFEAPLLKGEWKTQPNNPHREDGSIHHYAPPEHVASEMDNLIKWHLQHMADGVSPEVEAAWLHHRFTQIHPFQDGNGRVARNLATLVFLKAGWFPLVIIDDFERERKARIRYISALEQADVGDLQPLITLFSEAQRQAFMETLSLSREVMTERASYNILLDSVREMVKRRKEIEREEAIQKNETYAHRLKQIAAQRLEEAHHDLSEILPQLGDGNYSFTRDADPENNEERIHYFYRQIIQIAQIHRYWANMNGYKAWARLVLRVEPVQTDILFSFHPLGREQSGVMVCSAIAWRRLPSEEDDDTSVIRDIEPLSDKPFAFTPGENLNTLEKRFRKWLEEALLLGIDYFRRGV